MKKRCVTTIYSLPLPREIPSISLRFAAFVKSLLKASISMIKSRGEAGHFIVNSWMCGKKRASVNHNREVRDGNIGVDLFPPFFPKSQST